MTITDFWREEKWESANLIHRVSPQHLCLSVFQTKWWWSHACTRPSVTNRTASKLELKWSVALAMTVTGLTGATATGITTTTAQGLWPPAQSCWSQLCCCVWPLVSCEILHLVLSSSDSPLPPFLLYCYWFTSKFKSGFMLLRVYVRWVRMGRKPKVCHDSDGLGGAWNGHGHTHKCKLHFGSFHCPSFFFW